MTQTSRATNAGFGRGQATPVSPTQRQWDARYLLPVSRDDAQRQAFAAHVMFQQAMAGR